jgi:hypothetical protein
MVTCECGNSIEVPTLSGLKKLEAVKEPAVPKTIQHKWTLGHSLIFVGGVIILVAIGFCGWLFWYGPSDPYANFTPEGMIQAAQSRTPLQSLRLWQMLVRGGLEHHKRWAEIDFEDKQAGHQVLWLAWSLLPITGFGLVAAGIIVLNLKKKKPGTPARV